MRKKVRNTLIVVAFVVTFIGTFVLGSWAATSWKDQVKTKATQILNEAGGNKKTTLINNIDTAINDKIASQTDGKIEQRKQTIENQLQLYFDSKVNKLIDPAQLASLDGELDVIMNNAIIRFQKEIDTAFANR